MTDNTQKQSSQSTPSAFSDKKDDLHVALDTLYIYGNASGRNKFREKWPDVADYIFGDVLIQFDQDGVGDFDLRKSLEEEADSRRFFLKETIGELEEKSVDSAILQDEYVGKVIDAFGPQISCFLYSDTVIARVRPSLSLPNHEDEGVTPDEKTALTGAAPLAHEGHEGLEEAPIGAPLPPPDAVLQSPAGPLEEGSQFLTPPEGTPELQSTESEIGVVSDEGHVRRSL